MVRGPTASFRIDLEDLLGYADHVDARAVVLGVVRDELENGLVGCLYDAFPGMPLHRLRRYERNVRRRLEDLFSRLETARPTLPLGAVPEAREFFRRHPRDLSAYSVRAKDPVPDPNDLTLLMQLVALGHPGHLITRDGHFLAYSDLIRERWRIAIHDGKRLPLLLEEWRAAAP